MTQSRRFLCWDTSSQTGAVAAFEIIEDRFCLMGDWAVHLNARHSEKLLWTIDHMLESLGWQIEELTALGVGLGPGSFTGIRIGVTTARTLGHALSIPLVGVSSLAALARPVVQAVDSSVQIVVAVDACKGEWYTLHGSPRELERGVTEEISTPQGLMRAMALKTKNKKQKKTWVAIGNARRLFAEEWRPLTKNKDWTELKLDPYGANDLVQGRYLAQLVWEGYQRGSARPAIEVWPRYLRISDAEKKLDMKRSRTLVQ